MKVLVINCGSSSLKYQLIDTESEDVLAKGLCERIGIDGRLTHTKSGSDKVTKSFTVNKQPTPTIGDAVYRDGYATVKISGEGEIHYTLDGSKPTKSSPKYKEPIKFNKKSSSCTIKAISAKWGCANSDVAENYQDISVPDAPSITLTTKDKVAQGKTVSVSWQPTERAISYTAIMYRGGKEVKRVTTKKTMASFLLADKSDTENFEYKIKVFASNLMGDSAASNQVTVWGMHPVKVTFVDRIIRSGELTEEKLSEVKQNISDHYKKANKEDDGQDAEQDDGQDAGATIENNILSVQKVKYDEYPSKPVTPSKHGFTFAGWTAGLYEPATKDKTVYGEFEINYYTVEFYNSYYEGEAPNVRERIERIGKAQKIMYAGCAVPPTTGFYIPQGYAMSGWDVDNRESNCFDFNYVDGKMKLYTSYVWENPDLPATVDIASVRREENCLSYTVKLTCHNSNVNTQARAIVTLYTKDGRAVYTQVADLSMAEFKPGESVDKIMQLNYENLISKVSAVLVGVKDDMTRGAVSKMVFRESEDIEFPNIDDYYWDEWSDWQTDKVTDSDMCQVQQKKQYRYSKKLTKESSSSTLSGWTLESKKITSYGSKQGPVYSNPSGNGRKVTSEQYVKSSNYKNVYKYYRIADSKHALWGSSKVGDYANRYNYKFDSPLQLKPGKQYSYYYPCDCSTLTSIGDWYHTVYSVDYLGEKYPEKVKVSDNYATRWYYQEPVYTYYFWKQGDWSSWSDTKVDGDWNEERTMYRYREKKRKYGGYNPNNDYKLQEQNVYTDTVEGSLNGAEQVYVPENEITQEMDVIAGPYYKMDSGDYILVSDSKETVTKKRYGRYTNGAYGMPCKELAEELYGGEWQLDYSDWMREDEIDASVTRSEFTCDNPEHNHLRYSEEENGTYYWDMYEINGESYCFEETREMEDEITYTDSKKYYLVSKDFSGKTATILVYKETNSDPTQEQLEYVYQTTILADNKYSFGINTKEMLDYKKTGNFIVALSLEGSQRLVNVKTIEAKRPEYTVNFHTGDMEKVRYRYGRYKKGNDIAACVDEDNFDEWQIEYTPWLEEPATEVIANAVTCSNTEHSHNGGTVGNPYSWNGYVIDGETYYFEEVADIIQTEKVSENGSIDVNSVEIPQREGYRFVKWDKSVINITENMDVDAVWVPETYAVVFVDYENQKTVLEELQFGDKITPLEVEPVEGKIFKGWSNEMYYVSSEDLDEETYDIVDGPYILTDNGYVLKSAYTEEIPVDTTEYYRVLAQYIRQEEKNRKEYTFIEEPYYLINGEYVPIGENDEDEYETENKVKYCKISESESLYVDGNTVIEAVWVPVTYSVKFVDLEDNVISTQTVMHGDSATPPEGITANGVQYTWDLAGDEWWNVTKDMVIRPFDPTPSTVAPPVLDASLDDVGGTFYASLSAADEDSTIYYSYYDEITEEIAKKYAERKLIESEYEDEHEHGEGGVSLFGIKLFDEEEDET